MPHFTTLDIILLTIMGLIIVSFTYYCLATLYQGRDYCKEKIPEDVTKMASQEQLEDEALAYLTAKVYYGAINLDYIERCTNADNGVDLTLSGKPVANQWLLYADAARQAAQHYVQVKYLGPVDAMSNILPALGLFGTILGLIFMLPGMATGDNNAFLAGVSIKLLSSCLAIFCYIIVMYFSHRLERLSEKTINSSLKAAAKAIKDEQNRKP